VSRGYLPHLRQRLVERIGFLRRPPGGKFIEVAGAPWSIHGALEELGGGFVQADVQPTKPVPPLLLRYVTLRD